MNKPLVRSLFSGPVDVVGDCHGEIDALNDLLTRLGYQRDGAHPDGRRLVFVGDLTDRGPDSLAVVNLVRHFVEDGRAQCVLGNHDLNILLDDRKYDNGWFFGEEFHLHEQLVPQVLIRDEASRRSICDFFVRLPLALERPDLRVVHACWHSGMIEIVRNESSLLEVHEKYVRRVEAETYPERIDRNLAYQNRNPVRVLTSGIERRAAVPFESSGKVRHEERVPWWMDYADPQWCVFGHYGAPPGQPHGHGRAVCIDYEVSKRHRERLEPGFDGTFRGKLAAFRFPERSVIFDDGTLVEL